MVEGGHVMRCACCKVLKGRAHKMSCSYDMSAEACKRQVWEKVPQPKRVNN